MDILKRSSWFAIHAKARRESFAASNLTALGLDIFLPELKVERMPRGIARETSKPLFLGYFFARFCPELSLEAVKCARGVLQVVSSGRYPICVEEAVICEIQSRVGADGFIRLRQRTLMSGERVCIEGGPLQGMMGRVERELDDRKRVVILLEALWHSRALIERRYLQAAAA